jgi:hypothetical protein
MSFAPMTELREDLCEVPPKGFNTWYARLVQLAEGIKDGLISHEAQLAYKDA